MNEVRERNQWIDATGPNEDGRYYVPGYKYEGPFTALRVKRQGDTSLFDVQALHAEKWHTGTVNLGDAFMATFTGYLIMVIAQKAELWLNQEGV